MFLCDEKCESVKIFPRWLVCCIRISFVSVWLTPWWTLYLLLILTLFFPSPASSCFLISVTIHTLPLMTTQRSKPPQQLKIIFKPIRPTYPFFPLLYCKNFRGKGVPPGVIFDVVFHCGTIFIRLDPLQHAQMKGEGGMRLVTSVQWSPVWN